MRHLKYEGLSPRRQGYLFELMKLVVIAQHQELCICGGGHHFQSIGGPVRQDRANKTRLEWAEGFLPK